MTAQNVRKGEANDMSFLIGQTIGAKVVSVSAGAGRGLGGAARTCGGTHTQLDSPPMRLLSALARLDQAAGLAGIAAGVRGPCCSQQPAPLTRWKGLNQRAGGPGGGQGGAE